MKQKRQSLIKNFIELCERWSEAQGDSSRANKLHGEIHSVFKSIRELDFLDGLEKVIHHDNHLVAMKACLYYISHDSKTTIKRLEILSKRPGIEGFAAQHLIDQWKKGEINYDY